MGDCKAQFAPTHENAVFAIKGKYSFPGHRPKDVVSIHKLSGSQMIHPTEKPVGLMAHLITSVTKPGDLILDPFAGSGSTLVAVSYTHLDVYKRQDWLALSRELHRLTG